MAVIIANREGGRVYWGEANARYWARLLSMANFLLGFLLARYSTQRQALHDRLAGTIVLNGLPSTLDEDLKMLGTVPLDLGCLGWLSVAVGFLGWFMIRTRWGA